MSRSAVRALYAAILLAATTSVTWADSMRCGSKLVREEDTASEVRARCGEPTDIQRRTILRRPYYDFHGRIVYYGDGLVEVPVEVWTYNFGPFKLMRRVRIVDGLVDEIETLGYGYRESY